MATKKASAPSTGAAKTTPSAPPAGALHFTVFTATVPDRLTKVLTLAPDGTLHKESAANMMRGSAVRTVAHGLQELADVLEKLDPAQATSWGVCDGIVGKPLPIVPEREVAETPGAISRTRRHFAYPVGPGVMMLDHDGAPDGELSADVFRQRLIEACPALADAPVLWRPSCSAGVEGVQDFV